MHCRSFQRVYVLCGIAAIVTLAGCESILSLDGDPKACRKAQLTESVTNELAEAFIPNWVINDWDCWDGGMVSVHSRYELAVVSR